MLGVGFITFFVVSAAGPLVAMAGGVPVAMLLGNGAGIPATFLIVLAILLIFSAGYTSMARYVTNAGAFYAFTTRGLGGTAGGGAAIIAIVAYNTDADWHLWHVRSRQQRLARKFVWRESSLVALFLRGHGGYRACSAIARLTCPRKFWVRWW